ncbi:MAG: glycosyltransferase [Candidatus Omnitrophota bacterium]
MPIPNLSVIICSHNPNPSYLNEALAALRNQTQAKEGWELILIDNASDTDLSKSFDLSWHPNARHCREEKLGIVFARIRAMQEAKADLILFVDYDNILNPDYIEKGLAKAKEWPIIGAWGGQLLARFECEPPEWTRQYWKYLGIRKLDRDKWSNLIHQYESTPAGAGMFLRKPVWLHYLEIFKLEPKRAWLGTVGKTITRCEDSDLAFCACDIGLGTARFKELILTHIMPKERLQEDYMQKLIEGTVYSMVVLESFRGKNPYVSKKSLIGILLDRISVMRLPERQRKFFFAEKRGFKKACKDLKIKLRRFARIC